MQSFFNITVFLVFFCYAVAMKNLKLSDIDTFRVEREKETLLIQF